jgi:hypothetical protein
MLEIIVHGFPLLSISFRDRARMTLKPPPIPSLLKERRKGGNYTSINSASFSTNTASIFAMY